MSASTKLPAVQFIPITDPEVAVVAWEVFELTENRQKVQAFADRRQREAESAVSADFHQWLFFVKKQRDGYIKSIEAILRKRGMSLPSELDDLMAIVRSCRPGDKLVCHVAMLKCYTTLSTSRFTDCYGKLDMIPDVDAAVLEISLHEVALFDVERKFARLALVPFRVEGYAVEGWWLVANPFGHDGGGPRWEVNPPAVPAPALRH